MTYYVNVWLNSDHPFSYQVDQKTYTEVRKILENRVKKAHSEYTAVLAFYTIDKEPVVINLNCTPVISVRKWANAAANPDDLGIIADLVKKKIN